MAKKQTTSSSQKVTRHERTDTQRVWIVCQKIQDEADDFGRHKYSAVQYSTVRGFK